MTYAFTRRQTKRSRIRTVGTNIVATVLFIGESHDGITHVMTMIRVSTQKHGASFCQTIPK